MTNNTHIFGQQYQIYVALSLEISHIEDQGKNQLNFF